MTTTKIFLKTVYWINENDSILHKRQRQRSLGFYARKAQIDKYPKIQNLQPTWLKPRYPKTLAEQEKTKDQNQNQNQNKAFLHFDIRWQKTTAKMAAKWWRTAGGGLRALSANSPTPAPSSSSSMRAASYHTIQAIPRELTGSRISARDRAQGRIPAVVFGQSLLEKNHSHRSSAKKHLLTTERKQIQSIVKSVELPFFCSTRFPLQIRAGSGSSVLLDSGTVLPIKASLLILSHVVSISVSVLIVVMILRIWIFVV